MKNTNLILKLYSITLTLVFGYFIISGFKSNDSTEKFDEITVERINVVEPDGKLKMVISNSEKQHPGMFDGEILMERNRPPGIIFFNEEQDEVGGLIYRGNKDDGAGMVLSFDQYKNDQVMQMQYQRNKNGKQKYGVNIWDRPEKFTLPRLISAMDSLKKEGVSNKQMMEVLQDMNDGYPISAQRLFTGKDYNEQVGVFIKDEFGNDRINLFIDKNNEPKFQILDKDGDIIKEFTGD
ncbi:MAG: hypothetical protein ACQERU_13150 [Bacteroidota bacterium]